MFPCIPNSLAVDALRFMAHSRRHMQMEWRFPMLMTIRCYGCGKVFDVFFKGKGPYVYPCPACGRGEVFDLARGRRRRLPTTKR